MSHKYTSSIDSSTSSLTSLSSTSSFASLHAVTSVRNAPYKEAVEDLKTGPTPLQSLVETATALIDMLAANEQKNIFEYNGSKLNLDAILRAMLHHAEGCGGETGERYTASAICRCAIRDDPENEQTLQMLHDLAKTWVSRLLLICKCQSVSANPLADQLHAGYPVRITASHSAQQNMTPSGNATPTLDDTDSLMDRGVTSSKRDDDFKDQVGSLHPLWNSVLTVRGTQLLQRDGYQCVVSGLLDETHPHYSSSKNCPDNMAL